MTWAYPGQYVNGLLLDDTIGTVAVLTVTPLEGGTVWTTKAATTALVGTVPLVSTADTTRFDGGNLTLFATPGRYRLTGTINGLAMDALEIVVNPDPRDVFDEAEADADLAQLTAHLTDAVAAHAASAVGFTPAEGLVSTQVQAAIQEVVTDARATYVPLALAPIAVQAAPYNVVADGVTVNTTAMQSALDAADSSGRSVYLGEGTILTGALTYRNQHIYGDSEATTQLRGLPSQDVLRADPTLSAFARDGRMTLDNLTVCVDDSVDASASFPARGGVGNACLSYDQPDALLSRLRLNGNAMRNVTFRSTSFTSGGQNKSCGLYAQNPPNGTKFDTIRFNRLAYGWWDDYPTSNLTVAEHAADHNQLTSIFFGLCGRSMRRVNLDQESIDTLTIQGGTHGLEFVGVQSLIRGYCERVEISNMFIEDVSTVPVNFGPTTTANQSRDFLIHVGNIAADSASPIQFSLSTSVIENLTLSASGNPAPVAVITGNRNDFSFVTNATNATAYSGRDLIQDDGFGNIVKIVRLTDGSGARSRVPEYASFDSRLLHGRDSSSLLMGHVDDLFANADDLLVHPDNIVPSAGGAEGVAYSYVRDTTADLGRVLRILNAGGNFSLSQGLISGLKGFLIGEFLPATKIRMYVKAKLATGGTQVWTVTAGGVTVGTGTLTWTTTPSVQYIDLDLTGYTSADALGLAANTVGGGGVTPLDIQWVGFRPYQNDLLLAGGAISDAAPMVSAINYSPPYPTTSTATPTVDSLVAEPVVIGKACTLNRISVEITTAGSAGSVVRLGIYRDSNGQPGALLLDAGTVDSTTTGSKSITISQAVLPGTFWLAAVAQVAAPVWRAGSGNLANVGNNSANPGNQNHGSYRATAAVSGALPATWAGTNGELFLPPRLFVRAA